MARTKMNQRSASRVDVPMGATGGRTPPSKITVALLAVCIISAVWALAMLTPFGRVAYVYFFAYSEFYMGVLSLVALSITIMLGLVATDRLVLSIRQRVLLQSAHRTTGVIAVASLGLHLWTKLMEHHIRVIDMVVPFLQPGPNRLYVGFGTLSGLIMVWVMWTGIARARFVGKGKPWMWRSVHAISYLMWPIALVHGLSAGRPAATWVIVSYIVCILFVLIGLAVRLSVSLNRRKDFSSSSTGSLKPVGSLVPTAAPGPKKRTPARRREPDPTEARVLAARGAGPAVALETWVPAAPPAPPVSPAPAGYDDEYRRGARSARYAGEEDVAPRTRPYTDDEPPAPRQRRAEPAERYAEPTRPVSRRALDEEAHRYAAGEVAAPRARRRAEERYDEESRARARQVVEENRASRAARYAEDDELAVRPGRAARRYPGEEEAAARARGYAGEEEAAPRTRRRAEDDTPRSRRYPGDDGYDEVPRQRRRADEARSAGAHAGEFRTGELRLDRTGEIRLDRTGEIRPERTGEFRYGDGPASPRSRPARYAEDGDTAPRTRRDRGANVDRTDSGRHSRSEFVDLAEPADPWGTADPNYLPPDETPTLVDMASRRARRAAQPEAGRGGAGRGSRRGRSRADDDIADEEYWRQLRGEAQ